ncbi:phosphatidylinositol transfer protein Sfh5p [[Candida] railenensis]|uniref:Phosphatidylinositol transfer protein SFH5 n=1 Tax=[Candida] railenensis TaxID=45579 RepID=A0A9P0VWL8_9ASCO|nr:phosphatidylinositol transfer protein Sfh5p [[Candida] railenensis]
MALITSTKLTDDQSEKLQAIIGQLPKIIEQLENPEYDEIFGYRINTSDKEGVNENVRNEILYKYLVATEFDVALTVERLVKTLNWRNTFRPLSAAYKEKFESDFEDLGVITVFDSNKENLSVVTWNLYKNIKSPKKLFEKQNEKETLPGTPFLRWRIGLMERSLSQIDFTSTDNNKIAQIHDYKDVSFFKVDPGMKEATKEIIAIFGDHYPELLSIKFFMNVPTLMSWMFAFVRLLGVGAATVKKFQVLNSGDVSSWFPKKQLPAAYGGEVTGKPEEALNDLQNAHVPSVPVYGKLFLEDTVIAKAETAAAEAPTAETLTVD